MKAGTEEQQPFRVDVDAILKKKNPGLYRILPGFVLRWLKKILHQAQINEALTKGAHLRDAEFANFSITFIGANYDSIGKENIPAKGGAIVVSNHPLGGLDGMAFLAEACKVRPDSKIIVNDLLMNLPQFENSFIPVNKLGSNARESLQRVESMYAGKSPVLIFPAGICSRKQHGSIMDMEWNKAFIARSKRYQHPVIPTFITGLNSRRFYNLAYWRKKLGIKANIEMFFLADEMFAQNGKKIRIIFGRPIPHETFDNRYSAKEWADLLRHFVYLLNDNPSADFESFVKSRK